MSDVPARGVPWVDTPPARRSLLALPAVHLARRDRDALRRRLLAAADTLAVLGAAVSFALAGVLDTAFWAAAFLPVWIVLAKIQGLYDRDHRSLRHLTVDELPAIFTWALMSTALVAVLSPLVHSWSLDLGAALQLWLAVALSAFVLRGLARVLFRRLTPPERAMIVGRGPLAEAARRKLELFPDIHVEPRGRAARRDPLEDVCAAETLLGRLDRVIVASQTFDEPALADQLERAEYPVLHAPLPTPRSASYDARSGDY